MCRIASSVTETEPLLSQNKHREYVQEENENFFVFVHQPKSLFGLTKKREQQNATTESMYLETEPAPWMQLLQPPASVQPHDHDDDDASSLGSTMTAVQDSPRKSALMHKTNHTTTVPKQQQDSVTTTSRKVRHTVQFRTDLNQVHEFERYSTTTTNDSAIPISRVRELWYTPMEIAMFRDQAVDDARQFLLASRITNSHFSSFHDDNGKPIPAQAWSMGMRILNRVYQECTDRTSLDEIPLLHQKLVQVYEWVGSQLLGLEEFLTLPNRPRRRSVTRQSLDRIDLLLPVSRGSQVFAHEIAVALHTSLLQEEEDDDDDDDEYDSDDGDEEYDASIVEEEDSDNED